MGKIQNSFLTAKENNDIQLIERHVEPNKEEFQIILGGMLGDSWIWKGKDHPVSTYLLMQHSIRQLDYLLWKAIKLKRLGTKFYQYYKFNNVANRFTSTNEVRTPANKYITDLAKVFYQKGQGKKKIMNWSIIKKIDNLGLAVWCMDDGSEMNGVFDLCTNGYTEEEVEKLIEIINDNFTLSPYKLQVSEGEFIIRFGSVEKRKLYDLIKPYLIKSMHYKFKFQNKGKPQKYPIMVVCKRVVFDSAHFLEDHPAKCYNLHGGRYTLDVLIKGEVNPLTGMVMDYTYLKKILKLYIVDRFDHHFINDQVKELSWRSSTELMNLWIWFTLVELLPGLTKLKLWETPDSYCEFEGPSREEIKKKNHPYLDFLQSFTEINKLFKKGRIIGKIEDIFDEDLFNEGLVNEVNFEGLKIE